MFAGVVRLLRDVHRRYPGVPLRIDPAPLRRDPDFVTGVSRLCDAADTALTRRRAATVVAAGLDTADASIYARCPGHLAVNPTDAAAHAGCPPRRERVYVVGLPRDGGSSAPTGGPAAAGGRVVVRVVEIAADVGGVSVETYDDTYARTAGGEWTEAGRRLVSVIE
ncbi:MAG TPA: hypothetical protein VGD56_14480 [Gemmatirosa sp.]